MSASSAPEHDQAERRWRLETGLELASSTVGDPSGPPVLLVHGGGQTRHSWAGTARALADAGWWAISYDQRGHGNSDRAPGGDYSTITFAHDCVAMCDAVRAEHGRAPVVVGASLGGLAGLLAAGELSPGCASALVLVDVTPRLERSGVDRIVGFMLERVEAGYASLDEAADAVAAYQPHRPRPSDHSGLEKNLRLDPDGRWRWHWDPQMFLGERPLGTATMVERFDDAARSLELPTLLVRGAMSDLVSEQTAQHFLELCPSASFVDVSEAGHMVAGDRNDAFSAAVLEFLSSLDP